ncbi:DUF1833 family protein [Morganella morganii]|uniref:DUF1833 family protein n=1 Tax=Morganella morganii TaxID=582 RepID=UPI0029307F19|nr:DUF1833 family protein [Morganella morganii]
MPTLREFRAQRPNRILYETLQLSHPSFGDIYLITHQIFSKTLGGIEYLPCNFEMSESQQSKTPIIDASVKFSRVAHEFKQKLKAWRSYSRMVPVEVTYRLFDEADKSTAIVRWKLFAKDVSMDAESVSMTLSMTNPLNKNVGRIYEPQEWPGLEVV